MYGQSPRIVLMSDNSLMGCFAKPEGSIGLLVK